MPYVLKQAGTSNLWFVVTKATGKRHSNHPLTREMAEKQLRVLRMYGR